MNVVNFGRIIAYLAFVLKVGDSCDNETVREAVQRTVGVFTHIDLARFELKSLKKSPWFKRITRVFLLTSLSMLERC